MILTAAERLAFLDAIAKRVGWAPHDLYTVPDIRGLKAPLRQLPYQLRLDFCTVLGRGCVLFPFYDWRSQLTGELLYDVTRPEDLDKKKGKQAPTANEEPTDDESTATDSVPKARWSGAPHIFPRPEDLDPSRPLLIVDSPWEVVSAYSVDLQAAWIPWDRREPAWQMRFAGFTEVICIPTADDGSRHRMRRHAEVIAWNPSITPSSVLVWDHSPDATDGRGLTDLLNRHRAAARRRAPAEFSDLANVTQDNLGPAILGIARAQGIPLEDPTDARSCA